MNSVSPNGPNDSPSLVQIIRNDLVESVVSGSAVVTAPTGEVLTSLGSPDALMYPRSSLKPLQAIASLRHGARIQDEYLALACGSHRGSERHQKAAAYILGSAGLDATFLQCPAAYPSDSGEIARMAAEAAPVRLAKTPLAFNCSGKHAGFLSAARFSENNIENYLDVDHPVQREVFAVLEEYCGEPVTRHGTDGCGAPAPVLSLTGVARGFGTVAAAPHHRSAEVVAAQVANAMLDHPWAVHGETSSDTVILRELGLLSKVGAEGVRVLAAPDGTTVAVKAADGSARAGALVCLVLLSQFAPQQLSVEALTPVLDEVVPQVLGRGEPVGRVRLARDVVELLD